MCVCWGGGGGGESECVSVYVCGVCVMCVGGECVCE